MALVSSAGERRVALWVVCGLALLALAFRLSFMNVPMRGDEAWSFTAFASKPLTEGLSSYWALNNHLLNTLLMHLAYVTFGNEPLWLRLPALFAGVLLVPATFAVGRAYYSRRAGLLAAALVAPANTLLFYSTNARGYTLLILCFLLLLLVAMRLRAGGSVIEWAAFVIISALGFYAIPTMIYPFGIVVVWLGLPILIERHGIKRRRLLGKLAAGCAAAAALTLLLYTPAINYVVHLAPNTPTDFGNAASRPLAEFLGAVGSDASLVFASWMDGFSPNLWLALAAAAAVGVAFAGWRARYRVPLWLATVTGLIPMLLIQRPMLLERVWLFLLPLYFVVAAAGMEWLASRFIPRRWLSAAIMIGVTALTIGLAAPRLEASAGAADPDAFNPDKMLDFLQAHNSDLILFRQRTLNILTYYAMKRGETLDPHRYVIYYGPFRGQGYANPPPKRVFFVTTAIQPLTQVAALVKGATELPALDYSAPELMETFGFNQVYQLEYNG